jgi:2-haloacid dehalogenase
MKIDALTFDVFGTVTDWRSAIIYEGNQLQRDNKSLGIDWAEFASEWRSGYLEGTQEIQRGNREWMTIDELHLVTLKKLLPRFGVTDLGEQEICDLNRVWHRLQPWPEAVQGLHRLKEKFVIAALSNGNLSLLTHMAKNARLPWDCILSSEFAGTYKPAPQVYEKAAELLGMSPSQIMMVAAHEQDLRGAQSVGFRTAFVHRPMEFGPDKKSDHHVSGFDVVATDFIDLADQLTG